MNMNKWAKIREKGKQRFVLVNGVLGGAYLPPSSGSF